MVRIDPTTAVFFAAGCVVLALVLCLALRRHRRGDSAIIWLMSSNGALLVACLGVLAVGAVSFTLSSLMVISGAYGGICLAYFAVLRAEEQPLPWRFLGTVGLIAISAQGVVAGHSQSVALVMITSSILNTALCTYIVASVWRLTMAHGSRIAILMCLPFAAIGTGYAMRLPVAMFLPDTSLPLAATMLILIAMAWAAVILELGVIALRETQARERAKAALVRAEAATAARTRFLLDISHDLRTPLNAILGLSELMRGQVMGPLPAPYDQHAEKIHENGAELLELVSELLMRSSEEGGAGGTAQAEIDDAVARKFAAREQIHHSESPPMPDPLAANQRENGS